jgi:hypothetical protein
MLERERMSRREILRARIRFALRRASGFLFDIDAMLRRPEQRAGRIALWRSFGSTELNLLLDQLEIELRQEHDALVRHPGAST